MGEEEEGAGDSPRRARAHTRTRARVRHTVIRIHAALRLTPRHTPTHCHRDTHTCGRRRQSNTHSPEALTDSHTYTVLQAETHGNAHTPGHTQA